MFSDGWKLMLRRICQQCLRYNFLSMVGWRQGVTNNFEQTKERQVWSWGGSSACSEEVEQTRVGVIEHLLSYDALVQSELLVQAHAAPAGFCFFFCVTWTVRRSHSSRVTPRYFAVLFHAISLFENFSGPYETSCLLVSSMAVHFSWLTGIRSV